MWRGESEGLMVERRGFVIVEDLGSDSKYVSVSLLSENRGLGRRSAAPCRILSYSER